VRVFLLLLLLLAAPAAAQRVVSLNLCADILLLLLAPERIAGLTPLAADPTLNPLAAQASAHPVIRAEIEHVVVARPDLVLAGPWGARATLARLEARGVRVERLPAANGFAAIRALTRRAGAVLGARARAEALVAAMDAALAPPAEPRGTALLWQPRGFAPGRGTLADDALRAAGYANAAPHDGFGHVGLEALLAAPPGMLLRGRAPAFRAIATDLPRHAATAHLPTRELDTAPLVCGTPASAAAVAVLR
jgi:iron complex transport system substrate-binding protein